MRAAFDDLSWNFHIGGSGVVAVGLTAAANLALNGVPVTLSLSNTLVKEGNSGTTQATFTLELSQPQATPITLKYSTLDGTGVVVTRRGSNSPAFSIAAR